MTISFGEMNFPGGSLLTAMFELSAMIKQTIEQPAGRYRVEDLISAAAAFAGENMLGQIKEFDFSNHQVTRRSPVFSAVANICLSGDRSEWIDIPVTSAFGRLFALLPHLPKLPYPQAAFPNVGAVYANFAASRNGGTSKENWGTAPLTIPTIHWPFKPPMRCAYEIRGMASLRWQDYKLTPAALSEIAQLCLIEFLSIARSTELPPAIAMPLAMETMNAMAKTAPVLPKHIQDFGKKHDIS